MSRTHKDSRGTKDTILEIVKRNDGGFDLLLNRKIDHSQVSELSVEEWRCVLFGFCGEEFTEIVRTVEANGRATVIL